MRISNDSFRTKFIYFFKPNMGLDKIYGFRIKNTEIRAIFKKFVHFSRVFKSVSSVNC